MSSFLMKTAVFKAALVLVVGFALIGANKNWLTEIERGPVSHIVGDPDAPITVTEYLSYTCPYCRAFTQSGGEIMKLAYLMPGKARMEYRHLIANDVDLTATMMARCGAKTKFLQNHTALMQAQPQIIAKARATTDAQRARWASGPEPARRRAIAGDLGLYTVFEQRGYGMVELDRCLADQTLANALIASAQADRNDIGVPGTPSFAIDGELLADVHEWATLQPQIDAAIAAKATSVENP